MLASRSHPLAQVYPGRRFAVQAGTAENWLVRGTPASLPLAGSTTGKPRSQRQLDRLCTLVYNRTQDGVRNMREFDVVVVGGGNAAFCAALAAQECGASVAVLERASFEENGGNSRFTAGAIRF